MGVKKTGGDRVGHRGHLIRVEPNIGELGRQSAAQNFVPLLNRRCRGGGLGRGPVGQDARPEVQHLGSGSRQAISPTRPNGRGRPVSGRAKRLAVDIVQGTPAARGVVAGVRAPRSTHRRVATATSIVPLVGEAVANRGPGADDVEPDLGGGLSLKIAKEKRAGDVVLVFQVENLLLIFQKHQRK